MTKHNRAYICMFLLLLSGMHSTSLLANKDHDDSEELLSELFSLPQEKDLAYKWLNIMKNGNDAGLRASRLFLLMVGTGVIDLAAGGRISNGLYKLGGTFEVLFTYLQLFSDPAEAISDRPILSTLSSMLGMLFAYKGGKYWYAKYQCAQMSEGEKAVAKTGFKKLMKHLNEKKDK